MPLPEENPAFRRQAERHFKKARTQALRDRISSWLTGRRAPKLLSFNAVRAALREQQPRAIGRQQVPVEKIVGSVARYDEFTRQFLPLKDSLRERWINVESYAMRRGWSPIDLYQIGDVYFVSDGNHRVAVARQMDYDTIEANVWAFPECVEIDPDEPLDSLLIRLGERYFMEETGLEERIPDHGIEFTTPGRYRELLAQISRLQVVLETIDEEPMAYEDAVDAWYEMIYLPSIQIIHESSLLDSFSGRTEADLFVWLSVYRDLLRRQQGDHENITELVDRVAEDRRQQGMSKVFRNVMQFLGRNTPPSPLPDLPSGEEPR